MAFFALSFPVNSFAETSPVQATQTVQQQKTVKGSILDENGEPMIGVSVVVKGTTTGTVTDFDGNFSLSVPANTKTLEISYIGYKTQNVTIGNAPLSIKMQPDNKLLDEVVVIGYGAVKKRDLTGAVASVKSEDITLNPGSNPMEALQGKVAGLDITKTSGQAGAGINMQLRGNRSLPSISADESDKLNVGNPTFIIDGMPGDYATLNPNDIESIEILKDAASTAVYGSSGANGVVLITTKNGKAGKLKVDFNAYAGYNGWSELPKMRKGESYMKTRRDAYIAGGGTWNSAADDEKLFANADAYQAYLDGKWIDWPDVLLEDGFEQNYSISVSGGTEKTQAYMSMNFSDEQGQYRNDNYKVYSTNAKIKHSINNKVDIGINLQASYTHQNKRNNVKLDRALSAIPLGDLYLEDGSVNPYPSAEQGAFISLLLDEQEGVYKNRINETKLYVNPYIEIKPIKGLSILSRIGGTLNYSRTGAFNGKGSYNYYQNGAAETAITAKITQSNVYNYKWENIVTYNFQVAKDHDFTVTGVTSWNHNQTERTEQSANSITNNKYLWYNMEAGKNQTNSSKYTMSKGFGIVGRINYSYLGKYLFSASCRWDGASRLAKGNQWDTFPAVSAAWRISDESFMDFSKSWLDNLKLRIGYGVSGTTAGIDPYSSSSSLNQSFLNIGNEAWTTYTYSQTIANKGLSWEKSYNTNIGLDLGLFNNRINLTADYYMTKTKDVIYSRSMPFTIGAYSATAAYNMNLNVCETQNRGFEMSLSTRNIVTKDFTWNSTLTFSTDKEKILSLTAKDQTEIIHNNLIYRVGEAINSYYNYRILGMWQKGEEADAAVFNKKPGDIKIETPSLTKESEGVWYAIDENGNKTVYDASNPYTYGTNDYQVIGKNTPDWTLGFQNNFTWKDFDLSIFMYMRWGQMINYGLLTSYDPTGKNNFPEYFNYWTENNPSNDFPAATTAVTGISDYIGYSALSYVDGSFFKIKNITLGYTLPKNLIQKIGLQKCRFYGTITNPLVLAKSHMIKDYDPEMNGSYTYPLTKQLVFGVNVTF